MHKIKLILLLILPISVFAQDLGIIDTRTTKNPALNGTYRISTDGKNLFFRNFIGISEKVANTDSATFTGLITLPSTTSIGSVSSTELSYLDGVTSSIQTQLGNKQPQLNGTGFVKASGTTISYDNSTYLTTSSASSTYLPLAGGTITGSLTLNNGAKFVGQVGTLYNGNQVYVDFLGTSYGRIQSYNAVGSFGMPLVLQGSGSNVGIGIVPTSRKLEVSDVIRSIGGGFEAITPLSSGSSYQWLLNSSDNKYYLNSSTDKFVSNFSTRLLVDNSGNVGIGTTSPSEKLNVTGNILASGTVLGSNLSGTNTGDNATNTQYSGLAASKQDALNGTGFVKASGTTISYDNSTYLTTSSAASTYLPISNPTATGTLTAPTIANTLGANFATTSGNVGIGTTSPSSILHTIGTIQTSSTSSASSNYANRFNNIVFSRFDVPTTFTNAISNSWSGTTTDQTMNFEVGNGSSTRVTTMTLLGNGNVGIGTTAPSAKLHVEGTGYNSALIRSSTTTAGGLLVLSNTTRSYSLGARGDFGTGQFNIVDETAGAARFTISQAGNVLVGSSASDAGYKLDVTGTSRFTSKMIINSAFNSGLSLLNGSSNGQIYNDGNLHLEAAEYLWINGNSTSLTQINAGGGNTYINSGGGRVGIGTITPAASAVLDVTSTTQGVLFPRLTTTQINAIASPANGLTVYNTTLAVLCFYDGTGWKRVVHVAM